MVDSQSITKQMVNYRMWREWRRTMLKKRKVAVRRKQLDMWNKKVLQKSVFGSYFREYIVCFHMTSRWPYWCPKTMKRRPCLCPKPVLWKLNFFYVNAFFVSIKLHRCWPRAWKHRIDTDFAFFHLFGAQWKKKKHPNSISQMQWTTTPFSLTHWHIGKFDSFCSQNKVNIYKGLVKFWCCPLT